jgi:hypothetical protein
MEKHPVGRSDILLPPESDSTYDSVLFEQITGEAIKQAAFRTRGAAGPSGVDAYLWRGDFVHPSRELQVHYLMH